MDDFLKKFREVVADCWDEETVSPKFLPIDIDRPRSLGQCAPTSQVLLEELRSRYPEADFTLTIGEVWNKDDLVIPYHVWIIETAESPKENKIIDVTADQSGVLPEIVYRPIRELSKEGSQYISYEQSRSKRFIHAEAARRYKLLKKRYDES